MPPGEDHPWSGANKAFFILKLLCQRECDAFFVIKIKGGHVVDYDIAGDDPAIDALLEDIWAGKD